MPSRMERRHTHCGLQSRRLEPPARRAPTPQAPVIPHETPQDNDAPPQGIGAR